MYQSTHHNEQRLQALLASAVHLINAERGCIMFANPETGELEIQAIHNYDLPQVFQQMDEYYQEIRFAVARYVIEKGPFATFNHPSGQDEYGIPAESATYDSCIKLGIRCLIGVPIHLDNNLIGVLYAEKSLRKGIFQQQDVQRLEELVQVSLPKSST